MNNEKFLNNSGLSHYDTKIKEYIDTAKEQAMSITSGGRSNIGTPTETGYMRIKDGDHTGTEQINLMYNLATSNNTLSLMYETSGDFEHDKEFIIPTTDYVDSKSPTIVNEGATFTNATGNQKMKIRTNGNSGVIIKDTNADETAEYWSHELPNKNYIDTQIATKQDKLTPSTGIIIDANNEISIDSSYPTQIYVDNKLALKQDKLVSGTNIRTVDGKTLLGSGNIALPTIVGSDWGVAKQGTVTVSGTTASTVSISDLNLTSANDYQVAITPTANTTTPPYINKSVASFTVTIANNSGSKTLHYTIFAKGYGSIPAGGSTGQVLTKKSGADGDVEWAAGGGGGGGGTVDQTYDPTSANAQSGVALATPLGDLNSLTTTNKDSLVNAINDVDFAVKNIGEPFRVVNWASNTLNVQIVPCTSEVANTSLAKMIFTIDTETGAEYQIVGMIAYEVFDAASGGNRINCWPVCQFTGNGQKELSVRWMCGGTTNKTAKRINAWVLLKHR